MDLIRRWTTAGRVLSGLTLGFLLCLGAGCGGGGGSSPGAVTGTSVDGRVIDDTTTQPIPNATIKAGGRTARTGVDGRFVLPASAGTVDLSISASNYLTQTLSAVVQPSQPTDIGDVRLTNIANGPPPPPQ
jgi:carboxypeptidase family protein